MKNIKHPNQIPSSERREDLRILPFVENGIEYKYCFILLNPFYQRKNRIQDFESQKPIGMEDLKSIDYKTYSWTEFLKYSGIQDIKDVFHCLYVMDHNYVDRFQKVGEKTWQSFQKTINENQLITNADSYISILIIDDLLSSLQKIGYQSVGLYSMFDDNYEYQNITQLMENEEGFPMEFRLVTMDKKILFYQKSEHYETYVFSKDLNLLQSYLKLTDFEGFYATAKTTFLWNEVEFDPNEKIIKIKIE